MSRMIFVWTTAIVLSSGALQSTKLAANDRGSEPSTELQHILDEQSELRSELSALEQETRRIKQRLRSLDRLAELHKELDQLVPKLERAESSDDDVRAKQLELRIEPLERQIDHLREEMEVGEELDERIDELQALIRRLKETEGLDEAHRAAEYLANTVDRLRNIKETRSRLNSLSDDAAGSIRDQLEKQTDELEEQVDADDEFVELVRRLFEAAEGDSDEDIDDLLPEIDELRVELESHRKHEPAASAAVGSRDDLTTNRSKLSTGEYFIVQSWSQEKNFRRPYYVRVPEHDELKGNDAGKLPVFIFLHGNGGNAMEAMNGFIRHRKTIASQYIMVFAQGYRESWNIVSERSKADDVGFVEAIVLQLAKMKNVDPDNFTIMGASNGAALVNQLAIESKLPNIRNYISGVSQLNVWQYDGEHFKAKGDDNNYRKVATPMNGKRLLNISGVEDKLVPYGGGPSKVIPAKDGKLAFVAAEESTFVWARQMGYVGEQLPRSSRTVENVEIFSYLDGDVVHYKVTNEGHGATHGISEQVLLDFLDAEAIDTANVETKEEKKRQPR